jgi:biotin carboxylase
LIRGTGATRPLIIVLASSDHAQRLRPLFVETCAAVYNLDDADLVSRLQAHAVAGIVTFSEAVLRATSALATTLGLTFHDLYTVEGLTDKGVQRSRLRASGVDSTAWAVISSVAQWDSVVADLGLPVVVKPARGVASRNAILIQERGEGRAEIDRLLREEEVVVAEEYLRGIPVPAPFGDYVSVESVVCQGERCHFAVTGKFQQGPPFRESGHFWPAQLDPSTRDTVITLADRALEALDVRTGLLHTEVKLTPDGPRIIEVNGRMGGYMAELAWRSAAVDLIDVAAQIACGARLVVPPIDTDRVFFQYTTPGPTAHGKVTAVCRPDALKGVAGVTSYQPLVRPGAEVGGVATLDLDMVAGDVPDHDALASTMNLVLDRICHQFELDGRPIVRTARDLIDNM